MHQYPSFHGAFFVDALKADKFNAIIPAMKIKALYISIVFSFSLMLASCERVDTGTEITVKLDTKYSVSWDLSFTIDSINEYRCPSDVVCIWGGDVDLYFRFGIGENSTEMVNLNNRDTNPFNISGYSFEVLDVLPYPRSDIITDPGEVRVKLLITGY